jgi:heterotetrameric sarcosine oxidase gamma subunit
VAELVATDALDGLALPVAAGRCRLAALPGVARAIVTAPAEGARLGIGQWLVEGKGEVDVSDAFAGLALDGPAAAEVLARLVPLDLEAGGLPARTLLRHTPVVISRRAKGFALLVPRSYAASAVEDLVRAMRAVAAREGGDA